MEVTERAVAGDPHAEAAHALVIEAASQAAMWLITITDPERLILTGAAGLYPERWRNKLRTRIMELVDPNFFHGVHIDFTELGRSA
ncbi:hypothetical protein [Cumulibacter soli]|uniref:hypothetical protein n=1 Tax=Cumulibacter soli TaxID=2546344 RepID=UPI00106869FB|nr:hypothetical protein [Cumulibacter soli]